MPISLGNTMEFYIYNFVQKIYDLIMQEIDNFGHIFLIGLGRLVVWSSLIILFGLFLYSFSVNWEIPVGIIVFILIIEGICQVGNL